MKKFRTIVSVIMMCLAGIVGLFFGGILDEAMGGAILFSMIAGIACIVYAIEKTSAKKANWNGFLMMHLLKNIFSMYRKQTAKKLHSTGCKSIAGSTCKYHSSCRQCSGKPVEGNPFEKGFSLKLPSENFTLFL